MTALTRYGADDPRAHAHLIRFPGGRTGRTEFDYISGHNDLDDMLDGDGPFGEELGFLGSLIGAVAGPVLGALGIGGKKKKGAAPAAAPGGGMGDLMAAVIPAIEAAGISPDSPLRQVSIPQIQQVVKELLGTLPPSIRQQVSEAIRDAKNETGAADDKIAKLVKQIRKQFRPQLAAAAGALKLAATQRDATSEHRGLVTEEKRWRRAQDNNRRQDKKLDQIEARLKAMGAHLEETLGGHIAIVKGERRIDILGGPQALRRKGMLTA